MGSNRTRTTQPLPSGTPQVNYVSLSKAMSKALRHRLSRDIESALLVGRRHGGQTVILQVDAEQAAKDGIAFYCGNNSTWPADAIPAEYLSLFQAQ